MAPREEIREGIKKLTEDRFKSPAEGAGLHWDSNFNHLLSEDILNFLHSQGVVIKVAKKINGNLVNELYDAMGVIELEDCKLLVKQALNKAGYVAVEPLIKEG